MSSARVRRKGPERPGDLIALALIAGFLLVSWSVAVPIFEAPDEPHHWLFARYLHDNKQLPVFTKELVEANSPPLYYILIAPLASETELPAVFVDKDGKATPFGVNVVLGDGKPALRIYRNDRTDFGKYWPIRAARLVTAIISVLAVIFTYFAGREATGQRAMGLLAAGLVAFLLQFSFRGSQVSNDSLVMALGALSLYLVVRLIRRGFTWPSGLLAGAIIAGAYLSKINAIFLPVPLGLTLLTEQGRPWRQRVLHLVAMASFMLALVIPWTLRNIVLYGDPFAKNIMYTVVSSIVVKKPITSYYFRHTFPVQLSESFVGTFGWMNLWMPSWMYVLYATVGFLAVGGLVWGCARRTIDWRLTLILLTMPFLNLLIVIYINLSFNQPQGRYLFPALPAIALLAALGLEALPGWRGFARLGLLAGLLGLNVFVLSAWLIPAYWG